MSAILKVLPNTRLRVALAAPDLWRRRILNEALTNAGYIVVDIGAPADVILADGNCVTDETRPTVILGESDRPTSGSLSRHADAHQIDAALRAVAAGLIVRSPAAKDTGFAPLPESDVQVLLTPRELEVLGGIMGGLTNKLIARQLDISQHTVKFHVESVFRKLGVRTRAGAVAKVLESSHFKTINL